MKKELQEVNSCLRNLGSGIENSRKLGSRKLQIGVFILMAMLTFTGLQNATAQIAYTEGFNSATLPTGWVATGFFTSNLVTPCEGTHSMRGNRYSGSPTGSIVSPSIGTSNGGLISLGFEYKIIDYSTPNPATPATFGTIEVQYGATATGPWTTVYTINALNHMPSTSCATVNVPGFSVANGPTYLRYNATWAAGDYYIYLDNIIVSQGPPPACSQPSVLAATPTASGASLGWQENGTATAWEVEYGSVGFTQGAGTTVAASTNPTNISGLSSNTAYSFYVRANCGVNGYSLWSGPFTFTTLCSSQLSGAVTINSGLPASATNFTSFTALASELNACGISGPVTVTVAANSGPYNERFALNQITGSSGTNTVTIDGNNNLLTFNTSVSADRATVLLDGTDYVTINNLKIEGANLTWAVGIQLINGADYNTINNCEITTPSTVTSSTVYSIAISNSLTSATTAGNAGSNNVISNNTIIGGYYGITVMGTSTTVPALANQVINNTIVDFHLYGLYFANQEDGVFSGNDISRTTRTLLSTFYGIYWSGTNPGTQIVTNRIHDNATTSPSASMTSYPMYASSGAGTAAKPMRVQNNAVYNIRGTGTVYGMYLLSSSFHIEVYHNTIILNNPSQTGSSTISAFYHTGAGTGLSLRNNNFYVNNGSTGSKYGIWFSSATATISSNYNNIYTQPGGLNIYTARLGTTNYVDLAAWQAVNANAYDQNSVAIDPVFANEMIGNIAPLNAGLNDLGTPLGVLTDLNNVSRSTTTPDLGALEFTGIASDLAIVSGLLKREQCYGVNDSVKLTVTNVIGVTIDFSTTPLVATWNVTGPTNSNGTITVNTGTLAPGASIVLKGNGVSMPSGGMYLLNASIAASAFNLSPTNDVLPTVSFQVNKLLAAIPTSTTITNSTDTVNLQAFSGFFPSAGFKITEVSQFRGSTTGAPVGGWPAYMISDDYIEITGAPFSDLAGITLETWSTTALTTSYTFPSGTVLGPNGTAIIAIGEMGASAPSPANYYYHGNGTYTGTYGSTTPQGRILKDGLGNIMDAVGYSGSTTTAYTFPAASNVTATDWSASLLGGGSSAGIRLEGLDNNTGSNWVLSATSAQNPNAVNANVVVPAAPPVTGFDWMYNASSIDTATSVWVGPWTYTSNGTHKYIARYNSAACGLIYDTATVVILLPLPDTTMSGVYTINPALTATARNFTSFQMAVDSLNHKGVSNAVTINVVQGTYTEQLVFTQIVGATAMHNVTFQADATNTLPVVLTYAPTSSLTADNNTIYLNGVDHIAFNGLTIESAGTTYSRVVLIGGNCTDITFNNNIINGAAVTTSSISNAIFYYSSPVTIDSLTIDGNTFNNGSYVFYLLGSTTNLYNNLVLTNNTMNNFYYSGFYGSYWKNVTVTGNNLVAGPSGSTQYGLYFSGTTTLAFQNERAVIEKNNLQLNASGTLYGIYTSYYAASSASPSSITNNMISNASTSSTSAAYGIYPFGCNYVNVYHNSVSLLSGSSTSARAMYVNTTTSTSVTSTNLNIKNNVFSVNTGYAVEISANSALYVSSMNNNLFNYGSGNASAYRWGTTNSATLAAWQTASSLDANSVEGNPLFLSASNLHLQGLLANGAGDNAVGVTTDIDGDVRPALGSTIVDIGADEYTPPSCLAPTASTFNVSLTGFNLAITGVASGYNIEYGLSGFTQGAGTSMSSTNDTVIITGLTGFLTYDVYIQSNCGSSNLSTWSGPISVYLGYCTPAPSSVDGSGITNVTMGTINNTTVAELGNYGNYSAMQTNVAQGATVPVSITFSTGFTYDTKIWVDWNDDLDFDDLGENVYTGVSTNVNPTTLAASFVVPLTAPLGNHRLRIGGQDVGPPVPCYTGTWGSYEDYTVNVTPAPSCPASNALSVISVTNATALVTWNSGSGATQFTIEYGLLGFTLGSGTTMLATNDTVTISGLLANTAYSFYVTDNCSPTSTSSTTGPVSFTTACAVIALDYTETYEATSTTLACWSFDANWATSTLAGGFGTSTTSLRMPFYSISNSTPWDATSPVFTATGAGYELVFDHAGATYTAGEVDTVEIYYSMDAGATYSLLVSLNNGATGVLATVPPQSGSFTPTAAQWATYQINLPVGANRLRLRAISDFGNNVYLDNVTVRAIALQQVDLPITFDNPLVNYNPVSFGGAIDSIVTDPTNPTNKVLRQVKPVSAATWAGTTLGGSGLANAIPFAVGATIIQARVWSPDSGTAVLLKAENTANGALSVETMAYTSVAGAWDTLTFNFLNNAPSTPPLNYTTVYDKLSVFCQFGTVPVGSSKTYYVDDVMFVASCGNWNANISVTSGTTPVAGAQVVLNGTTLTSSVTGDVQFQNLPNGTYPYSISLACYGTVYDTLVINCANATAANTMMMLTFEANINVTDGTAALAGAEVILGGDTLLTNASGVASFTNLPNGMYPYSISKNCHITLLDTITVNCANATMTNALMLEVITSSSSTSICKGDSVVLGTQTIYTAGVYSEVFSSLLGCDSTVTLTVAVDSVDNTVTTNGLVLTANLAGGTYQWVDCATQTPIAGATSQSYTAMSNGSYAVIVSDGTCADVSACINITNFGIDKYGLGDFGLYPNPSDGRFVIDNLPNTAGKVTVEVVNLTGVVIYKNEVLPGTNNSLDVDLRGYAPGMYQVRVSNNAGVGTKSFVLRN